jgi:hypothetical protein
MSSVIVVSAAPAATQYPGAAGLWSRAVSHVTTMGVMPPKTPTPRL